MSKIRRKHSREFKFKVAIEALKEQKTIAAICREYAIHESQVHAWKKQLKDHGLSVFDDGVSSKSGKVAELESQIRCLNEHIGELSMENKFFKKNSNF
jgi:transposase